MSVTTTTADAATFTTTTTSHTTSLTFSASASDTVTVETHAYLPDPQLATAMREATKVAHQVAENSVFTKRFLKGEISKDEYGRYITSLYFVYRTLEALLEKHKDHDAVKAIHYPHELARLQTLQKDLEYYYDEREMERVTDPATMTPAVKAYVNAMESAAENNPALLVAHSYTRYLGDLSGGQILAKRLKKSVLGLTESDGSWDTDQGLHFYAFNHIGNQSAFKAEYREKLDTVPVTQTSKDLILAEAVRSFELNIGVFDEIQKLSEEGKLVPTKNSRTKSTNTHVCNNGSWSALSVAAVAAGAIAIGVAAYTRLRK